MLFVGGSRIEGCVTLLDAVTTISEVTGVAFSPSDLEDGHWFMRRRTVLLLFQSRFDGSIYSRLRNFHFEGTHGLRGVPFLTVQDRAFYQHGVRLVAVGAVTGLTVHPFHNTVHVSLAQSDWHFLFVLF